MEYRSLKRARDLLAVVVVLTLPLALTACRKKADTTSNQATITTTIDQTTSFKTAINFLNTLERYSPNIVQQQILANLRDWSRDAKTSVEWTADPLFNRLPNDIKTAFSPDMLIETEFQPYDVLALQEAVFMRDISKTVASQGMVDPLVAQWFERARNKELMPSDKLADLSLVFRLFDWTVRNIQLDAYEDPNDYVEGNPDEPNAIRHQYFPWETLVYGHGDWLERSRVFILLCRQIQIDAVMLEAERGADEANQPWAVGVLLGDDLYLFDAELGLPLPGQGERVFGTLEDYVQNPELLDRLSGETGYRIGTGDLKNVVANIDATPFALSQRMKQVESKLSGKQKMILTVTPSAVARTLRALPGITSATIWKYPYRGYRFQSSATNISPELAARRKRERQPFLMLSPLMQARLRQFKGDYLGTPDEKGANRLFQDAITPKKKLKKFSVTMQKLREDDPESVFLAGLTADEVEAEEEFKSRMEAARQNAIWSKDHALIWMAMVCMDTGQFKVATDHLKRVLENENSIWLQSANYNLARAYAALGIEKSDVAKIDAAIERYVEDKTSPQFRGNLLRAQRLQKIDSVFNLNVN